jgi:hypothetical protein
MSGKGYGGCTWAIAILFKTPFLYPDVRSRIENKRLVRQDKRTTQSIYPENFMTGYLLEGRYGVGKRWHVDALSKIIS